MTSLPSSHLLMLGTGYATATRCFNTCFLLQTPGSRLMVDAGGGNGVLTQLERAGVPLTSIGHLFLTHAHTDHLLGAVWMVRMVAALMRGGQYAGTFTIHSHERALHVLDTICRLMLPAKDVALLGSRIVLHRLCHAERFEAGGLRAQCFDIGSTKEQQFGFRAELPGGRSLVCLGDEPFHPGCHDFVAGADWLLCEAFCLERDAAHFHPREKHHSTALEAGREARALGVGHLLLYHTEDRHLDTRRRDYTAEAARHFAGPVVVPDDLEVVPLD